VGVKQRFVALLGLSIFIGMLIIPVWVGASSQTHEHYEHRLYLSLVGLLLFVSQLNIKTESSLFNYVIFSIIVLFALKTLARSHVYKNKQSFINEGLKESPDNYIFNSKKAEYLFTENKYSESLIYFDKALLIRPKQVDLLINRANVYVALGNKEKAFADFNKAIELDSDNIESIINRCVAYNQFGDIEQAMLDIAKAKKINPNKVPTQLEADISAKWIKENARFLNPKIITNKQLGIALNQQIQANAGSANLYIARAQLYIENHLDTDALMDLKKACELEPTNAVFKRYYMELNESLHKH